MSLWELLVVAVATAFTMTAQFALGKFFPPIARPPLQQVALGFATLLFIAVGLGIGLLLTWLVGRIPDRSADPGKAD